MILFNCDNIKGKEDARKRRKTLILGFNAIAKQAEYKITAKSQ
jgi:hypothetical protein